MAGASRAERSLKKALLFLLALSPLALGGTHPIAMAGLSIAALLIAVPLVVIRPHVPPGGSPPRDVLPLASLAFAVIALWTLLRGTPLLGWLAPGVVRDAHALWADVPLRASLVPAAAGLHALKLMAVAVVIAACAQHFSTREGQRQLGLAVIGAAGITALVGWAHVTFEADKILFFYQPLHRGIIYPWGSTFVNPNQTATVLGLGSLLLVCGALQAQRVGVRLTLLVLAVLPAMILPKLDAKGATGAFLIALLVLATCSLLARLPRRHLRLVLMGAAAWSVVIVTAVGVYWVIPTIIEGRTDDLQKFFYKAEIWHRSLQLLPVTGAFGTGPFSFGDLYPATLESIRSRHSYVEAAPLQVLFDHGWILGSALIVAVVAPVQRLFRRTGRVRSSRRAIFWSVAVFMAVEGITGMGQQSVVVALLMAALYGSAMGMIDRPRRRSQATRDDVEAVSPEPKRSDRVRPLRNIPLHHPAVLVPGALLLIISLVSSPAGVQQLLSDRQIPLLAEIREFGPGSDEVAAALAKRARWRPGEPELVAQAAILAAVLGDADAARARVDYLVRRVPGHRLVPRVRSTVARRLGDREAQCEIARDYVVRDTALAYQQLLAFDENPTTWAECLPAEASDLITAIDRLAPRLTPGDRLALVARVRREHPDDPTLLVIAAEALMEWEAAPAAGRYLHHIDRLGLHSDRSDRVVIARAQAVGDTPLAMQAAERVWARAPEESSRMASWIDLQLAHPDHADRERLAEIVARPPPAPANVQDRNRWLIRHADVHLLLDDPDRARELLERVLVLSPNNRIAARRLQAIERSPIQEDRSAPRAGDADGSEHSPMRERLRETLGR